ncbi:hypothetical protein HII36_43260 [Nonomuraea sp. NN258]|uniref:hypothetical protein n=1 Tax=Nonomuraea antri TaxID=2730852 RepID=UPI0015699CC3|nr:hypothetical protein [Nonomuraea antri]NRQ38598.1 hypothetical protein [Nonomuraea antri]
MILRPSRDLRRLQGGSPISDPEAAAAGLRVLLGLRAVGVGRALNLGIVEFDRPSQAALERPADDRTPFALHLQCPFRIAYEGRIILGSGDIAWREADVRGAQAAGGERTMYDFMADHVDRAFAEVRPAVIAVDVTPLGDLRVELEHQFTVQAFPVVSGRKEAWRFLERAGEHVVFPPEDELYG